MRIFVLYQIKKQMEKITLATLPQATAQEVFDQVAVHLIQQGEKSVNSQLDCMYRDDIGRQCAAGCLISDEEYSNDLENASWSTLVRHGRMTNKHRGLIKRLQMIHDNCRVLDWPSALHEVAEKHDLNTDALNAAIKSRDNV